MTVRLINIAMGHRPLDGINQSRIRSSLDQKHSMAIWSCPDRAQPHDHANASATPLYTVINIVGINYHGPHEAPVDRIVVYGAPRLCSRALGLAILGHAGLGLPLGPRVSKHKHAAMRACLHEGLHTPLGNVWVCYGWTFCKLGLRRSPMLCCQIRDDVTPNCFGYQNHWKIHQMDIKSIFLNNFLEDKIYVK